ncbi:hypothetical protein Tco_1319052 [Tanacetum coccineum]
MLPESLTSPEMKETKAYKTYLGFATGATPPKKARKFKKPASPQLTTVLVSPKESMGNSKRVKRHAKKSTKAPARGVVIRETPEMPLYKKKEKVDVTRGIGIDLLSEVALIEEAQYQEVRRKSMRDFYKTHPSGSSTITKTAPSAAKIKPYVTSEGTGVKPGVPNVTKEESSESEAAYWGNDKDDSNNEQDSSDSDHETDENESDNEDEAKIIDKDEVNTDKGFIQEEGTNAEVSKIQQVNENPEISQVIEDAHVTLSTVPQKTEVLVTSSSYSSDLEAKFLNFLDIPNTNEEIVSPTDVHVHHEVPSQQTPTLLTVLVLVIFYSSLVFSTVIPQSLPSFIPPPQQSTSILPPTTEATNPPSTLPGFASVFQFNNRVTSLEKEVVELKKDDPLKTQVTALVDENLD